MSENIGPHLLGRYPSPKDPKDYLLSDFLTGAEGVSNTLDTALTKLLSSKGVSPATKEWATFITDYLLGKTVDPNLRQNVIWKNPRPVLDQEESNHCIGFSYAQWGNTTPVNDKYTNQDAHDIYYECKAIEGLPKQEDGTSVRAGAKAMKARKRINAYAFATSVEQIRIFLQEKGPIVLGTGWTNSMFKPDTYSYVKPVGSFVGGHAYLAVADLVNKDSVLCLNSWGNKWGNKGYFKMKWSDFRILWDTYAEAVAAVELP